MKYCTHCGAYIPEGEDTCPACGHGSGKTGASGAAAAQQQYTQTAREEKLETAWEPWKDSQDSSTQTGTQSGSGAGGTDTRRLSVLSYVGPLFLLPLFLHKNDAFVRYHANQGAVLFVLEVLISALLGDGLLAVAGMLFCVYCLVLGAKNVAAGRMSPLPLIGKFKLIK